MSKVELNDEQKNVVRRYVEVWRRFRRLPDGDRSFANLDEDLAQGPGMLLCGILVEAEANSVITADVKDLQFFAAIFRNGDSAVPDMTAQEVKQARQYIIHGKGTAAVRWWWVKPPFPGEKANLVGRGSGPR